VNHGSRLCGEAILWTLRARLALARVRFDGARSALVKQVASTPGDGIDDVTEAISRAARLLPGTHCLAQALAGQAMLARHGHRSTLHLGVEKHGSGVRAHAWVEIGGRVLTGSLPAARFRVLAAFDPPIG